MEKTIDKKSNILDPVHDILDQDVFNGTTPKDEFFEYHMDHIREVFRQNNFNPHAFDFYLTGSLCTYQYSETSDVDISIVCNASEFSEEDRADLIAIVIESLDGEFFPRTKHQYQHFVQPIGVDIEDLFILGLRSAWDFQKKDWVLKPKRAYAHNVQKEKPDWILAGVQVSDKINTLIDNHKYDDAMLMYKNVHQKRKEDQVRYGDYSEGNIVYKFLDNNGTFDRLRNIGQRIASQKVSLVGKDFVNYYYNTIYNGSYRNNTHLNSKGMPCSCEWGTPDPVSLRTYYDNLLKISKQADSNETNNLFNQDSEDSSKPEKTEEELKKEKIITKILDSQLNTESRWAKRYPDQTQKIREAIPHWDEINLIDDRNIKFLSGAINIYKKEIERADPKRDERRYLYWLINQNYRGDNPREIKKRIDASKEALRSYWTNNYGKSENLEGFPPIDENVSTFVQEIIMFVSELKEEIDYKEDYRPILGLEGDLLAQDFEKFVSEKMQELKNKNEYDGRFITTIATISALIKRTGSYENKIKYLDEFVPKILDGSLFNFRPEDLLDFIIQKRFEIEDSEGTKDRLGSTLNRIKFSDVQRLVNEYQDIKFPTNLDGMKSFNDVEFEISNIQNKVKEREEYKELLERYHDGDINYDDDDPVFTFEVKKGNPEKAIPGTWGVYRINTTDDMELEGDLMQHCVGNEEYEHWQRRNADLNTVYSVRDPNGIPWATIELDIDGKYIGQGFGRHNQPIRSNEQKILSAFFGQESFQRESSRPNLYVVVGANGEEYQWEADDPEHALEQHKDFFSQNLQNEEAKKETKPVAVYGAGHNWFQKATGQRTGHYGNDLPEVEPEISEVYVDPYDYYNVNGIPEVNEPKDLIDFWEWVEYNNEDYELIHMFNYYRPDDETPPHELDRDEYGNAIVRIVEPLNFDGSLIYSRKLIEEIILYFKGKDIFDENGEVIEDTEEWDELPDMLKGLASYMIVASINENLRNIDQTLEAFDLQIQKLISNNNNKNENAILIAIREVLDRLLNHRQGEMLYYSVRDIEKFGDSLDINNALEIEFGSYEYSNFNNTYMNIEVEPSSLPDGQTGKNMNRSLDLAPNYIQHAIDLCNQLKQNYNTVGQEVIWFNEPENQLTVPSLELEGQSQEFIDTQSLIREENVLYEKFKPVVNELKEIVDYISVKIYIPQLDNAVKQLQYNRIMTNKVYRDKVIDDIISYLEYLKNKLYREKNPLDPSDSSAMAQAGQTSFYLMPPEPSTEEFERWEKVQQGLLATTEPDRALISWPEEMGYLRKNE